jgi:hypothetical protein
MVPQRGCLRGKRFRFAGPPRVGRNSSGFGLIDALLALFISATLIAPVMGGILIVLKTATDGAKGSVITGQRLTNRQYFDLNLTSAQMRSDWRYATIVKTKPRSFSPDVGLDCQAGLTNGSLAGTPPAGPAELVVALQVRSRLDERIDQFYPNLRGDNLQGQGLTRVVYTKKKSGTDSAGNQLYDLIRRECAMEINGTKPKIKETGNDTGSNNANKITADKQGWRLQPGYTLDAPNVTDVDVPSAHAVLKSIRDIEPSGPCNGLEYPNNNGYASDDTDPAYNTRCNLNFTVTFLNGSTHIVRLYQGNGS